MTEHSRLPLRLVDGLTLEPELRRALRPGSLMADAEGRLRQLPRFFYEIESWEQAVAVKLAPHFGLYEFIDVDVREAQPLRGFPRYIPCAVTLLAANLELLRDSAGTVVRIAANGGYRSPGHARSVCATPHSWATAADIYRVGDVFLDSRDTIERYARMAAELNPAFHILPYGSGAGAVDDHLHLDLGYVIQLPRGAPSAATEPDAGAEEREGTPA